MALDGNALGTAIAAAVQANKPTDGVEITTGQLETMWQAIATAIVDHFKNNGEVLPGTLKDSMSGAITGIGDIN